MSIYDKNLRELQERVNRKEYLSSIMDSLYKQQEELKSKVEILAEKRIKEQRDVEKFEGRSLSAFFYEMIGKQEEKLSKERREAYEAQMKYEAAMRELEMIEGEIRSNEVELESLAECETDYRAAFDRKLEEVRSSDVPGGKRILEVSENIALAECQVKEIDEALQAGYTAQKKAGEMLNELSSAENWGIYDMLGGGFVSGMIKHEHIDNAQNQVEAVQLAVRRFNTELADVMTAKELCLAVGDMLRFADICFDGFIVDYMVQDKIEQSVSNVKNVIQQIKNVLNELEGMKKSQEANLHNMQKELEKLLVNL